MRRAVSKFGVSAALVAMAACSSTFDLGGDGDARAPADAQADLQVETAAASTPTCESICQKFFVCGLSEKEVTFDGCLAECRSRATPADLECVQHSPCNQIQACAQNGLDAALDGFNAALEGYEIGRCQDACDSIE